MKALTVGLLLLAACGSSTGPATTAINFRLDPSTCFDMGTPNLGVRLIVDGTHRATDTLSIGEFSKAVPVAQGSHTATAQEDYVGGYTWPTQQVSVAAEQVKTVLLRC